MKEKNKKIDSQIKLNNISVFSKYNKYKKGKIQKNNNKQIKSKYVNGKRVIISKVNKNNYNNNYDANKKLKNLLYFIDDEINELSYHSALKYDKRYFCQYYFSLIKTKHSLIFPFSNDYNSKIIKMDLFSI